MKAERRAHLGFDANECGPVFAADGRSLLLFSSEGGTRDVNQQPIDRDRTPDRQAHSAHGRVVPRSRSLSRRTEHGSRMTSSAALNIWRVPIKPDGSATMADAQQVTRENQHVEAMSVSHDGKWIAL